MTGAVKLGDLVDLDRLARHVETGLIRRRTHPSGALVLYDYTDDASRRGCWDHELRTCRGIVVDADGAVVARPFPRFLSADELPPASERGDAEVTEKLDGSLGILYVHDGVPAIATRGSFDSVQARWATERFRRDFDGVVLDEGASYLFEIVFPANRLVVDYGPRAELVLLAVLDTATGADRALGSLGWPGATVRQAPELEDLDAAMTAAQAARPGAGVNIEGWVVRYAARHGGPSARVKVKLADYQRIHRLLESTTPRRLWRALVDGAPLDPFVTDVPPGFARWVEETLASLRSAYELLESDHRRVVRGAPPERGAAAGYFRAAGVDEAVAFKMLDGLAYDRLLWRRLRPPAGGGYLDRG